MRIVAACIAFSLLAGCGGGSEDGGGASSPAAPGTTTVVTSQVIGPSGGTLTVTDASSPIAGTQVVIPAGALSGATTITIGQVSGAGGVPADALVAELGPSGLQFATPVSITVRYSPQYLANNGISDPATLKVVAMHAGVANETLRTASQSTAQRTVTAQVTRFSRVAVLGYTSATLSGSYAFNFYIMESRFGSPGAIGIEIPATPFAGTFEVPFPGYAFASELGAITFNGAGNYSWSAIRNNGGTPTRVSGSGTYTVSPSGALALDIGPAGNVLAGGSTFILTSTSGPVVEMGVGVKIGGAYGNASLSGTYGVAHYYSNATAGPLRTIALDVPSTPHNETVAVPFPVQAFTTELWSATFDGAGNYTWSGTRNIAGVSGPAAGGGTYSVAGDGSLSLDTGLTGHLQTGGGSFVLAAASGQPIEIGVGLKKGGTFSNASLGGPYAVTLYYSDPAAVPDETIDIGIPGTPFSGSFAVPFPSAAFNTEQRTMTFNGAGAYTWSGTRNRGGVTSPVSGSGTYDVAADGVLSTNDGLAGNVLSGGSTFLLSSTSGQALSIGLGMLR